MKKYLSILLALVLSLSLLFSFAGCDKNIDDSTTNIGFDVENGIEDLTNDGVNQENEGQQSTLKRYGDLQSARVNVAEYGGWIYYSKGKSARSEKKIYKAPVNSTSPSEVVELYNPSANIEHMAKLLKWYDNYSKGDIITVNYIQVVDDWVYWSSDCAIWRIRTDGTYFGLVAKIGTPYIDTSSLFWVCEDWIYYANNSVIEYVNSKEAKVQHSICKQHLGNGEIEILYSNYDTIERATSSRSMWEKVYHVTLKTACLDGRVYFISSGNENIMLYKDSEVIETNIPACHVEDGNKLNPTQTTLVSSENGVIYGVLEDEEQDFKELFVSNEADLSDAKIILDGESTLFDFCYGGEDFVLLDLNDCEYFDSGISMYHYNINDVDYEELNDVNCEEYFNATMKKINSDRVYTWEYCRGSIVGDYFYYYNTVIDKECLCRINLINKKWENVDWLLLDD